MNRYELKLVPIHLYSDLHKIMYSAIKERTIWSALFSYPYYIQLVTPKVVAIAVNTVITTWRILLQRSLLFIQMIVDS